MLLPVCLAPLTIATMGFDIMAAVLEDGSDMTGGAISSSAAPHSDAKVNGCRLLAAE